MFKAAIVGCGRIASLFDDDPKRKVSVATHAGAYKSNTRIELVAAADIDPLRLKNFGERWGLTSLYADYVEMLERQKIDILSVCTWNSTHYAICKNACLHGVKAIFCEKPITDRLADADKMVELCREKKVILAVNHLRRWDKLHQQIKQYIAEGKLGKIQGASAYYTAGIANTGTHLLDILRLLFGEVEWLSANFKNDFDAPDPCPDVYLYFKQGFGVTLQGMDVGSYLILEIDIFGTKGRLRIKDSGFSACLWEVVDHPEFSGYKGLGQERQAFGAGLKDTMANAVNDIIGCINTATLPMSSGEDGRAALELICAIHASGKEQKGGKVFLPLKNRDMLIGSK